MIFPDKVRVLLTRKDIYAGCPGRGDYCPITIAMRRALGLTDTFSCITRSTYIYIKDLKSDWKISYSLPQSAQKFVDDFDASAYPENYVSLRPFWFVVVKD